jgi:hypothetical protein
MGRISVPVMSSLPPEHGVASGYLRPVGCIGGLGRSPLRAPAGEEAEGHQEQHNCDSSPQERWVPYSKGHEWMGQMPITNTVRVVVTTTRIKALVYRQPFPSPNDQERDANCHREEEPPASAGVHG